MPPENVSENTPLATAITPTRLGKFKASRMIVKQSWALLKQDKEILWFPVLSGVTNLIAIAILALIYFSIFGFNNVIGGEESLSNTGYLILFVYYIVSFFIINFFQAGMLIIVKGRFDGQNLSFMDGINGAFKNIGKIFDWALISATLGMVLQLIADRFKLIGRIVSRILGAAWVILTYFSLPSLIIGQNTIKGSFKESAAIIRKTWGETIIVNFGVGLFFGFLIFIGFAVTIAIAILAPTFAVIIPLAILFFLYLVGLIIVSSSLNLIFKLALYEYAKSGKIVTTFSSELLTGAIKSK